MARKRTAKRGPGAHKPDHTAGDPYLEQLSERHRDIALAWRRMLRKAVPDVTESLDWGLPVYHGPGGRLCYLKSFPTHVRIGFWRGAELPDAEGLLHGEGDGMRHVRLRRVVDVDTKPLRALMRAATRLEPETSDEG